MKSIFLTAWLTGAMLTMPSLLDGCPGGGDPTPPPGDDDTEGTPPACPAGSIDLNGACVPDLPEGWTQIKPGAPTICARGSEFSYFVRPGKVNKLVIGFDGGGACWDALTCSQANPTFSDSVDENDNPNNLTDGVFEDSNPENPFRDWFAVYIPYCTGDIHWGDNTVLYPASNGFPPVTIRHKGFVNASSVMDWVYEHFESPERIFITGVSAGSYGTMMFAPYVMENYPASEVVQLGDSGAGVITQDWLEMSFNNWNAQANIPSWIPEIHDADITTLTMNDIYIQVARYYPDQVLSQYNTASDDTQEFFYDAMGGDPATWGAGLDANIEACSAGAPSFRYFTAWGSSHGIIPYDEFYTLSVNGTRIRDWVAALAEGQPVENVHCTDCSTPEHQSP